MQNWDLNRATCVAETTFATVENGFIFGGTDRNPDGHAYVFNLAARGRALCAALSDGTVRLMDSQSLQTVGVLDAHAQEGNGAAVYGVAMSSTSPLLATADGSGVVFLWDLRQASRGPLAQTNRGGAVHSLAFVRGVGGSSAELLVAGGADKRICVHETTRSLAIESSVNVLDAVLCIQAAPDAALPRLAAGGGSGGLISDASISLWRLEVNDEDASSEAAAGVKRPRITADDSGGASVGGEDCAEVRSAVAVASTVEDRGSGCAVENGGSNCAGQPGLEEELAVHPPRFEPSASGTTQAGAAPSDLAGEEATAEECEVLVCQAGSCRRAGSEAVLLEIEELGAAFGLSVRPEGCLGECDRAPNVIVVKDGDEQLHTLLDSVERSAAVVAKATGREPNLDDPELRQRLTDARRLRTRQRAREERKWNAAMKGLAEQIATTADTEAQLELKEELAELLQCAAQWEAALRLFQQVMSAEDHNPNVIMQVGTLLGKLGKRAELDELQGVAAGLFDEPEDEDWLAEVTRHLTSCRVESGGSPGADTPRRVEGYARWRLDGVEPVSRHSALYRFTSQDRLRGTPHLHGGGRVLRHRTWHTTLLATVGRNAEGPLPWVERDYTPISSWIEWDKGQCALLVKIYPTGAATSWLHKQRIGSFVWLSEPMTTLSVPALVPDTSPLGPDATKHSSVLLVLAGTGIVVAANVLHHADPTTCFGTGKGRKPPLTSPISMIYACRHDDVLMASDIAKWCRAGSGQARLQRCVVAVSAPPTPFPQWGRTSALHELATLANVDVVDGRLTQQVLQSELVPLQSLGRCRVVVSGPAAFNKAVKEMLAVCGVTADAVTLLEA